MIFNKPNNKRIVDLCIEFDKLFPLEKDDAMHTKLYSYLYLIYYSLGRKKAYFKLYEDYEGYAHYAATTIYLRFLKKQKNGEPINSVRNYAESTLNPLKVAYQNENFREVINSEVDDSIDTGALTSILKEQIQSEYNYGLSEEMEEVLSRIPQLIKKAIKETPFRTDKLMCHRLYMSCLISLLKSFTLSNSTKRKLGHKSNGNAQDDNIIIAAYKKDRYSNATVWHLPESYTNYIQFLTNKVRVITSSQLEETQHSYDLDDGVLDTIMMSAYEAPDGDNMID